MIKSDRKRLELAKETLLTLGVDDLARIGARRGPSGECWTEIMPCSERTLLGCSDGCYTFNRC